MNVIERYYDADPQLEWDRLGSRHRTEFALTMLAFEEHLPKPPAKVLDIGGGPGRYAIALAQQGYCVTLCDLSQNSLHFARAKAREAGVSLADIVHGNAVDLSAFESASFDIVLLMGPLYHLTDAACRQAAIHEALRVLKPGGIIAAAFVTRYAPIRELARRNPSWILEQPAALNPVLETGVLLPVPGIRFTDAYLVHPGEVKPLFEQHGCETLLLLASEGVIGMIDEQVNATEGELWQAWARLNYRLGKDDCVHGTAEHLLYIGSKGYQES
jgi:S-adenosylmethionine-dependent methyltransferase